ncbi:MAG: translation elongation factor Ts, partial [Polyangiaceae bacterium]|nr:translation elongation factor Ts [Polyangiaceae bacterium]
MANISAQSVKSLRDRTGAGMMDCKKALEEASGDEEQAVEIIQKKGLAKVAKKAGAIAAEGLVHAYIHGNGRIGVLVEVNCQTDFVSRNEEFKAFVEEVALQVASASPEYLSREEIPADAIAKKREFFVGQMAEEAAQTGKAKPPEAVEKIVEGKISKWMKEICLLEQESMLREDDKDDFKTIVDKLSAKIGEKIAVRRFVRFELGEGIEKKKSDLA